MSLSTDLGGISIWLSHRLSPIGTVSLSRHEADHLMAQLEDATTRAAAMELAVVHQPATVLRFPGERARKPLGRPGTPDGGDAA